VIARPTLKTLNHIRQKGHEVAEAFDTLLDSFSSLPSFADKVPLAGTANGANTIFVLPRLPKPLSSLHIWKVVSGQGQLQVGNYALNGLQVVFSSAPAGGSTFVASFRY
jgi:hypothetical protein